VIRVALEGTPYFNILGIDMWPWAGTRSEPVWTDFNQAYWNKIEKRIRLAGEFGVGLDLVIYFTLRPADIDTVNQRAYWEYIITRLAKYSNILTWEMANEYTKNEKFQDTAGTFFHTSDPYHRPVCTSDGTTDDAVWPGKSWIDIAVNHSCTSSTDLYPLRDWYLAVARNTRSHGKPAFCNESGREIRHKNDDGVHRRKQGWLWCSAGGYWTWHSWDGCEGIDDTDYTTPGQEYLKPMADYFRSLPFWKLAPNFTVLTLDHSYLVSAVLADANRNLVSGYVCSPKSGENIQSVNAQVRLPDGEYQISFISPVHLKTLRTQKIQSKSLRRQQTIKLPAFTDDLIFKIDKIKSKKRTIIPGTE